MGEVLKMKFKKNENLENENWENENLENENLENENLVSLYVGDLLCR